MLFVFPGPELGGAERQGLHLARYLKTMGCEVHVWSTLPGEGKVVEECAAENFSWAAHRFLWPCRKSSLVRDGWRLIRALRKLRPDVILSYTTSPNVGCGLFWRFTPAKACIWGQRSINDLQGDAVERLSCSKVSAVICNAAHEVKYLEQVLGKLSPPIHVIHNGLDLAPGEKSRQEWRASLNITDDAVVIVMLANFRSVKDHFTLINSWARVLQGLSPSSPFPCLVLAGAPQFTVKEVKKLAEELELTETIRFPGQIKDVSGLLSACDIGVLISKHEGLPNAVLEYMAAGLPVIATDLPGNREALGDDDESSFCKPNDPDDLSFRLKELISSMDKRLFMGARNHQRILSEFTIQAMCEKTTSIIADLLKKSQRWDATT